MEQLSSGLPAAVVPGVLGRLGRALLVLGVSSFLPVVVPGLPAITGTVLIVGLSLGAPALLYGIGRLGTAEGFPEVLLRTLSAEGILVLITFFISRTEKRSVF